MVISVDIDGTIVDTISLWEKWIRERYEGFITMNETLNTQNFDFDVEEFWKNRFLYDNLEPHPDAIEVLELLSKEHKIQFVSHCFSEHLGSKIRFLDRYCNFPYIFYNEKDKYKISCDIIIDDRDSVLDLIPNDIIRIKSELTRQTTDKYPVLEWKEIPEFIEKVANVRSK